MRTPLIIDGRWHCPDCWHGRGLAQPKHGVSVCNCGFVWPKWCIDRASAIGIALKAARDGRFTMVDNCTLCAAQRAEGLVICMGCNRESAWCWEVDVMKFFAVENPDLSVPYE